MSAASPRAGRTRQFQSAPVSHPPETAVDIDRIHEPFTADIAQFAHAVRRLLDSGPKQTPSPAQSAASEALPHLHLM